MKHSKIFCWVWCFPALKSPKRTQTQVANLTKKCKWRRMQPSKTKAGTYGRIRPQFTGSCIPFYFCVLVNLWNHYFFLLRPQQNHFNPLNQVQLILGLLCSFFFSRFFLELGHCSFQSSRLTKFR